MVRRIARIARQSGPAAVTGGAAAPAPERRAAVRARGVTKTFRVPHERRATLKERVVDRLRRRPDAVLPAVDDVTFEAAEGEFLGIAGRNGSGKSTLLKCIAGIYAVDAGDIEVHGRLAPFVELGFGVQGELTGRENAMVSGVLLGLTRRQARERMDAVFAFAELEEFAEVQVKNYSSGMAVRLAFAIALQVDADVLMIDEVLAVGDAAFQEKCFAEFERLKREGRTVLFVSHDMDALERFCDRAVLLEHGAVVAVGEPAAIARQYREANVRGTPVRLRDEDRGRPGGGGRRRGPRRDLPSFARVTLTLALVQLKLHYLGSALGYLWGVLRPLSLFAVVYAVFNNVGGLSEGVPNYAAYLLVSLVLWTFFAEATSGAAGSLVTHQDLLRKLRFERMTIPLAAVLKAGFNLALNAISVVVLLAAFGVEPRWSWLQLPVLVGLLAVLATGVALLLSALFVRFRDIAQIWTVVVQLLFFGSSVIYVVTKFPEDVQRAMVVNPLAMIFTQMRHAVLDPAAPTAAEVAGSNLALLVPLAVIAGILALGVWAFERESPHMAERV